MRLLQFLALALGFVFQVSAMMFLINFLPI